MSTAPFAPWQAISVTDKRGNKHDFIVYADSVQYGEITHHVSDISGTLTGVGGPHLHGAKDYNLDEPDDLCFGCASCTEWNCSERGCYRDINEFPPIPLLNENGKRILEPFCVHIQAVIVLLKKKQEFKEQNIEPVEYTGAWKHHFDVTRNGGRRS